MKSSLPYHGVPMQRCRALAREHGRRLAFESFEAFEAAVRFVFSEARFREERYAALSLLALPHARAFVSLEAVPLYEWLIVEGAWWDLVDEVATHWLLPLFALDEAATSRVLVRWSKSGELWLRRAAIIAQVLAKEATRLPLLFAVIEPALDEKEFFLRKAIGWALRAAGKARRAEVRAWVIANRARLSGLSLREAQKSIGPLP